MDGEFDPRTGEVAPQDRKLRHWDELCRTDPKHTKPFSRAGGFSGTAIKPTWNQYRLTEHFGPCGIGWGFARPEYQIVDVVEEKLVYCTVMCWYKDDNGERAEIYGVGGDKVTAKQQRGPFNDDEAFKKALTDAIGNAFLRVGLSADVHMGLFEDSKYVQETRRHFAQADQPRDATPPDGRAGAAPAPAPPATARSAPRRPEAAPAPSAEQAEARKRWAELRDMIDASTNTADLDGIDGCEAWKACTKIITDADGDATVAANAMQTLRDRIEGQRQFLLGGTG